MPTPVVHVFRSRGIAATPGYSVFITPWTASKANTNWATRTQNSALLSGGWLQSSGAQNDEVSWDIWLDAGTYKFAMVHSDDSNRGIYSVQLDGVEKGTIDAYAAGNTHNVYDEITGIAVTAGLKVFKLKMATKNASSSAYFGVPISCAWIRTGA